MCNKFLGWRKRRLENYIEAFTKYRHCSLWLEERKGVENKSKIYSIFSQTVRIEFATTLGQPNQNNVQKKKRKKNAPQRTNLSPLHNKP